PQGALRRRAQRAPARRARAALDHRRAVHRQRSRLLDSRMRLVREKAGKHERQEEIRRLLRARRISTQQELAELLAAQGIEATQATLSRDLAELGVLRVSRPEGAVYELEPINASATPQLAELGQTILSLRDHAVHGVLRTRPGMASAVALAIDN